MLDDISPLCVVVTSVNPLVTLASHLGTDSFHRNACCARVLKVCIFELHARGTGTRGRLVLVDGTDVPTGNRAGHEDNYSGKRRRAGLNIQVVADGGLLGVSTPVHGSMHDRRAFTECGWEDLLADIPTIADPAYQGTHAITPRKKPKGGELSANDKANNKIISSLRSAVERCIAHFKNWKDTRHRVPRVPRRTLWHHLHSHALEFYRLGW
jgi:hypothetical protein